MDVNLVVLFGFCLFMTLSLRFGYKKAIKALDQKIDEIRRTLEHAELQLQLATSQFQKEKNQKDTFERESNQLKETQLKEDDCLRQAAREDLQRLLGARQENSELVMDKLRVSAIEQMRKEAARLTVEMVGEIAKTHLSEEQHQKINDQALLQLEHLLTRVQPANQDGAVAMAVNE